MENFNLLPILPEIFMALTAMGLLIVGVIRGNHSTPIIAASGIAAIAITLLLMAGISTGNEAVLSGMFVHDGFASFMKILIGFGLMGAILLSVKYLQEENIERFEYPVLVMLSGLGMMIMVSSNNMLALYMGLELQSLSLYVLAAFHRNTVKSAEAGIKYFVLGALSSGMLLFGISLIYGFTGAFDFEIIHSVLEGYASVPVGAVFGLVFILAGLAFKISAVPFHMWTPDVYEGAPTSVTAFFAIVPKVAALALLMRLLFTPFVSLTDQWVQIVYFLSLGSMIVGAFAAIAQNSIKRLLAYSSIGHMGYALIGIAAGTAMGLGAVVLYLMIYMIMSAGVFAIIMSIRHSDGRTLDQIDDLKGLSKTAPALAYGLAILMFSMAGIPPMAGFFGKLVIFEVAIAQEMYVLATLGIVSSVVAAYYYLRVIKVMFFDEADEEVQITVPFSRRVIMMLSLIFVIGFVLKPSAFVDAAQSSVLSLF